MKMIDKVAVIDLGTNTAHILIAIRNKDTLGILFKERYYTFLGEDGIENITNPAINRLYLALSSFENHIKKNFVQHVIIIGTEAFRIANNGPKIVTSIKKRYGWAIQILSGDEEASYIYKGVASAIDMSVGNYIVMDIGGGSVEYIISINGRIEWQKSFSIGIAKLHNLEFIKDPLSGKVLDQLRSYLSDELKELKVQLKKHPEITLVGAAGSFEILGNQFRNMSDSVTSIDKSEFLFYLNDVIHLPEHERAKLTWIPEERVKYVTMAIILIQVALELTNSSKILISPFAMKEGIASEYYNF